MIRKCPDALMRSDIQDVCGNNPAKNIFFLEGIIKKK